MGAKLARAVEAYFADLGRIRGSGGATGELSYHPALRNLLNAVGAALKLKASCIGELAIPATEGGRSSRRRCSTSPTRREGLGGYWT